MEEEAEALLHSSKSMNKALKSLLTLLLMFVATLIQYLCQDVVIGTMNGAEWFFGIFFDNGSLLISMMMLGLYTNLPDAAIQILGAMPFLLMIFFSTTFSPGAGVKGLKELRYMFSRFYLWCMIPGTQDQMEGCPANNNLLYLILASLLVPFLFVTYKVAKHLMSNLRSGKAQQGRRESMKSVEFAELQLELFGVKALRNLEKIGSSVDLDKLHQSVNSQRMLLDVASGDAATVKSSDDDTLHGQDAEGYDGFLAFLKTPSPLPKLPAVSMMKCADDTV